MFLNLFSTDVIEKSLKKAKSLDNYPRVDVNVAVLSGDARHASVSLECAQSVLNNIILVNLDVGVAIARYLW